MRFYFRSVFFLFILNVVLKGKPNIPPVPRNILFKLGVDPYWLFSFEERKYWPWEDIISKFAIKFDKAPSLDG